MKLFEKISFDIGKTIDTFIYQKHILEALKKIQEELDISLKDSLDILNWRYNYLRNQNPDNFNVSHENYWKGFFS